MSITPAIFLPTLVASDDERDAVVALENKLAFHDASNRLKLAYYEGKQRVRQLGISTPPQLRNLEVAAGWAGTTVDVMEERLDWIGWTGPDDLGLSEVFATNDLDVESPLAHLDALIYGTSFVVVGAGEDGEPDPLITMHSPLTMTGEWDMRSRRLSSALSFAADESDEVASLYLPDETVRFFRPRAGGTWRLLDRDRHRLGRLPVVQLENRTRSGVRGRSEITQAIRYYTDTAVRTLLGMEVNREFYSAPQRYVLGVDREAFTDGNGNVLTGWEAIAGHMLALPREPGDEKAEIGQFAAASPAPYLDQIRGLAQMVAAEAAIPAHYLGFVSDNPASADAIRASEARLVKRAERRQKMFGRAWLEVARVALMVRDGGQMPAEDLAQVGVRWRDAATPTRAAAADEAVKLISAGVLPPDSQVTLDRLGFTPDEQRQLESDRRRGAGRDVIAALTQAAGNAGTEPA